MSLFSQNKKIAVAALSIFIVSFSIMVFFLDGHKLDHDNGHASILDSHHEQETEVNYEEIDDNETAFVTDPEGTVIHTTNNFCELLKLSCSDFKGTKYYDYINSNDLNDLILVQTNLVNYGDNIEAIGPYRMIQGNHEILVLLNAEPILDSHGKVKFITYFVKDLTEKVESLNGNEKPQEKDWTKILYPKIKNMNDEASSRLMVDKISYKED